MWKRTLLALTAGLSGYHAVYAQNVKTYIPEQAHLHLPVLVKEVERLHPELTRPHYYGGLIEHESCLTLKHRRCWNPQSRLKTEREEGAGLGQLTRTWNKDGSIRFDILSEMRVRYSDELKELSWGNIYQRPDLQMRAMTLLSRQNYVALHSIPDEWERLAMADAAYNGGLGGVNKERRACGLAKNCNSKKWFGHVENYCLKSKKPLYGNRSACAINRGHVKDVLTVRMPKYEPVFLKHREEAVKTLPAGVETPVASLGPVNMPTEDPKPVSEPIELRVQPKSSPAAPEPVTEPVKPVESPPVKPEPVTEPVKPVESPPVKPEPSLFRRFWVWLGS